MSDQLTLEGVALEKKDKTELQAIVAALGGKSSARARKSDLIDQILELSGVTVARAADPTVPAAGGPAEEPGTTAGGEAEAHHRNRPADPVPDAPAPQQQRLDEAAGDEPTAAGTGVAGQGTGSTDRRPQPPTGEDRVSRHGSDRRQEPQGGAGREPEGRRPAGGNAEARSDREGRRPEDGRRGEAEGRRGDAEGRRSEVEGRRGEPDGRRGDAEGGRGEGQGREGEGRRVDAEGRRGEGQGRQGRQGEGEGRRGEVQGRPGEGEGRRGEGQGRQVEGQGREGEGRRGEAQGRPGEGEGRRGEGQGRQGETEGRRGEGEGGRGHDGGDRGGEGPEGSRDDDASRRRRRRGRDRDRDRDREESQADPVPVEGFLDLRDEGYGFMRVQGYLPTRDDVYVPVKLVRQHGLRRGDFVTGLSRPAARNEKNPALHQVDTVNGHDADDLPSRRRFEELTPLFPDQRLQLETRGEPANMTARIIDLVSPIGKGQRGLIVSPPKAGKTTVMKQIARAIEMNHPEVELIVLLVDERPEEVTDMRRWLQRGSVVASTFDRPVEEHCAVAELTIERAKRMVEEGKDVVVILDGITRLARAYNLAAPGTGRIMSGGVDSGALYPPKKFFGAARNTEEGGSLTILATALVDTGSKMDEVIFEEFKGTGNMELRLDRRLAERRVFPAVDVRSSSTRHEELLFERRQVNLVYKLRRVLAGVGGGDDANPAAATELLIDRLGTFRTNEEFLAEIARA